MNQDIEQRAEEYAELSVIDDSFTNIAERQKHKNRFIEGYILAMTEERERGKRFNEWLVKKQYGYSYCSNEYIHHTHIGTWSYDKLFNEFISEEKSTKQLIINLKRGILRYGK